MSAPATLAPPPPGRPTATKTIAPQSESGGVSQATLQPAPPATEERLLSLDTYRGLIMVALAFNGFGLGKTAELHLASQPDSSFWQQVRYQFSHVEWSGCAFWDMIQPSFMFMVGVSMAYSYVKRQSRGDSWGSMFQHALVRSLVLILLGVFLSSQGSDVVTTNWAFMNVLTQIGLGYSFLFLMWRRPLALQLLVVVGLLGLTGLAYTQYSTQGIDLQNGNPAVGIDADWARENLQNIPPAWHKNANVGHAIDRVVLNWFPRPRVARDAQGDAGADKLEVVPFEYNGGGYQTINFIPSLATMILGLICGELVRSSWGGWRKVSVLIAMGAVLLALGLAGERLGWPIIKRIWTPSWALFSTGICCWILATLYAVIDVLGWRLWSWFFVVVGMNSIAIYMMGQLLRPWTERQLRVHFGSGIFTFLGETYQPMLAATLVGLAFWLVCYWMMRQRIFIRV